MRLRLFETEVFLPAPPSAVFAFHQNPHNIPQIAGRFPRLSILEAEPVARVGETFSLRLDLGFFSMRWIGRWTQVEPDRLLVDTAELSPFEQFEHEHGFLAVDGGTRMVDRVQFSLGSAWLDHAAEAAALVAVLPAIFRDRQRRTAAWFGQ